MRMQQAVPARDARQRLRVNCSAQVRVEADDRRVVTGRLRDVGLNSLYLFSDDGDGAFLLEGEKVKVKVAMQRDSSTLTIELEGTIARMDDSGFVVQFTKSLRWWPVFIMFPSRTES